MSRMAGRNLFLPASDSPEEPDGLLLPLEEDRAPPVGPDPLRPGDPEPRQPGSSDFAPPPASAGERLVRLAYRLGVPGTALARPFGRPAKLRLLATVESPLPGNRVAGMGLRAGYFLVYGIKAPVAQMDFASAAHLTPPFERVVHGFTWLRDLAACAPAPQCAANAERVLAGWLNANPHPGSGPAWKVGHVGHRLLGWLVHAPLILSTGDRAARARTMEAIEETARWLDRAAGKADDRLDALAAWVAITAAGVLLPDGKPRRLHGEAGLAQALRDLVGPDGGVLSRSPLAQIEAIELLVELAACYRALRRRPPGEIGAALQVLVPPLLGVTHADGGIANWQGAPAVAAERVAALIAASGVRARPLGDAPHWGYQREAAGATVLLVDAAPPPVSRHALCGCASTLAFELSHGPQRLVVSCGGAATCGGQLPARIEQGLRATAAHSALVLGDANSTAVQVGGKLGSGVGEVEVDRRRTEFPEGGAASVIEASHNGYAARYGLIHRRTLTLADDGLALAGEDRLDPAGRKARRGMVPFALRFHLGPGVDAVLEQEACTARLDLPDGSAWRFVLEGATPELDESLWVDDDGQPHATLQLVAQGMVSRAGECFAWRFEQISEGME